MTIDEQIKANAETATALLETVKVQAETVRNLRTCCFLCVGGLLLMMLMGIVFFKT